MPFRNWSAKIDQLAAANAARNPPLLEPDPFFPPPVIHPSYIDHSHEPSNIHEKPNQFYHEPDDDGRDVFEIIEEIEKKNQNLINKIVDANKKATQSNRALNAYAEPLMSALEKSQAQLEKINNQEQRPSSHRDKHEPHSKKPFDSELISKLFADDMAMIRKYKEDHKRDGEEFAKLKQQSADDFHDARDADFPSPKPKQSKVVHTAELNPPKVEVKHEKGCKTTVKEVQVSCPTVNHARLIRCKL